jgi:hypothetical protein
VAGIPGNFIWPPMKRRWNTDKMAATGKRCQNNFPIPGRWVKGAVEDPGVST